MECEESFFVMFVLSCVSMIVLYGRERGRVWKQMGLCLDQWKDGSKGVEGFVVVLFILLSLLLD